MINKELNADELITIIKENFKQIKDVRQRKPRIELSDVLMSGFAMFSLKDPSLLAFDQKRVHDPNLQDIYKIEKIPSDTQMRTILDEISPEEIRPIYSEVLNKVKRTKEFKNFMFMDEYCLLSIDGTGMFSSQNNRNEQCLTKKRKTGDITYYQQLLGAVIVHPDHKEVIPLMPEPIIKQDGINKNDCERNAAKRLMPKIKADHGDLKFIIIEDGLGSNAPHIKDIERQGWQYIIGAKEGDHKYLFQQLKEREDVQIVEIKEGKVLHRFKYVNKVMLNESNKDVIVNFVYYEEIGDKKTRRFSWVTNIDINNSNVYKLMRGGRARWKIENETFNTLKNQGYNLEHNYGLGKNHLSTMFATLMMLAFCVDQIQQLCSKLFKGALKRLGSKRALWEAIRSAFNMLRVSTFKMIYELLYYGLNHQAPIILRC